MDKDLYNMNEAPQSDLSPINLVAIENNEVVTSSIKVAEIFGKKKILELEKDSCIFMNEVKAFLKREGHLLED